MSSLVYLNGVFVPKLEAKLSVYDHGLLYGDGVWEGLRLFNGDIFRLDDHVRLLFDAAAAIAFPLPFAEAEFAKLIHSTVAANVRRTGYIRVIVTRGAGTIGLDPRKCDPQVIILVEDVVPFPAELYGHGLHAITASTVKLDPGNPFHRVRSLSHGHIVMAKAEALKSGCLEAVLLTRSDQIAGCTEGTLFAVKDGTIRTPAAKDAIPFDVVRAVIQELAASQKLALHETTLTTGDLLAAEEVFLAGTTTGMIGIVRLDGKPIGDGAPGPVTQVLQRAFHECTRGANE